MVPKVNLLPKEELEKKPFGKFLKWVLSYGRYIIISVELVVLIVFFSRFIYDRRLTDLNESIEQKQAIVVSAKELEEEIRNFQEGIERVKTLEEGRFKFLQILEELKTITPKDVVFKNISLDAEKISLKGAAVTNAAFAQFLSKLKVSQQFSQVKISEIKKEKNKRFIVFQIEAEINPNPK